MGGALSCFEAGVWDHAHHVHSHYKPAAEGSQDMRRPLSHYFISSGHNSYLTGNQLTSTAGTATIELGLKHGCRVVEVDVYDGPTEPIVTHGGTLTSTVTLHDCVRAVAKHGFSASPYPVILTIENHTKAQQQAMAAILRAVLGPHLFVPAPGQLEADGCWLSPEELKHKVVVRMKVKPGTDPELAKLVYIKNSSIRSYDAAAADNQPPSSHSLPDSKLPAVPEYVGIGDSLIFGFKTSQVAKKAADLLYATSSSGGKAPLTPKPSKGARLSDTSSSSELARGRSSGSGGSRSNAAAAVAAAAAQDAGAGRDQQQATGARLGAPLASFQLSADELAAEEVLQADLDDTLDASSDSSSDRGRGAGGDNASGGGGSSELQRQQTDLYRPHLAAVLQYTSKHLLRCYPNALRMVDNSNPNPAAAWARGVSLAALNWQLWDQAIWVNEAFFSRHNKCGYILKPDWMTSAICQDNCPPARQPRKLSVNVMSAFKPQHHRVSVGKDDPYVCLQIVGMPHDTAEQSSTHKNNTGRLVVDRVFDFAVAYPELAVLLVLLKDHDDVMSDTVMGYATLPLANLAPGAYKLPLAKPRRFGGFATHTGMWVKLELQWQQQQQQQQHGDDGSDPAAPAPAPVATQ